MYNAFFYSLVSKDTKEMYFSMKRQQFLINQGYAFKIVTNLLESAQPSGLKMSTEEEQLDMLAKVGAHALRVEYQAVKLYAPIGMGHSSGHVWGGACGG